MTARLSDCPAWIREAARKYGAESRAAQGLPPLIDNDEVYELLADALDAAAERAAETEDDPRRL